VINTLLDTHHSKQAIPYYITMSCFTSRQSLKVKSPIVDINHHLNQVLLAFDSLSKELFSGFHSVDIFSDCFFFNIIKCKDAEARPAHLNKLENVYQGFSNNPDTVFIISNTSVKNNTVTSVSHIQREHNIITKTVHHAMNVSSTEAELFAIRCSISQATQI